MNVLRLHAGRAHVQENESDRGILQWHRESSDFRMDGFQRNLLRGLLVVFVGHREPLIKLLYQHLRDFFETLTEMYKK
jgi:hypothetical protein